MDTLRVVVMKGVCMYLLIEVPDVELLTSFHVRVIIVSTKVLESFVLYNWEKGMPLAKKHLQAKARNLGGVKNQKSSHYGDMISAYDGS
jgi:hypothetical protein